MHRPDTVSAAAAFPPPGPAEAFRGHPRAGADMTAAWAHGRVASLARGVGAVLAGCGDAVEKLRARDSGRHRAVREMVAHVEAVSSRTARQLVQVGRKLGRARKRRAG
mmetsp:Transcript_30043/g.67381  ORF Transcript_30043/g.67381 Transcript_30043/m.67381 type:complete len:108 (-) Transcript_30043:115-438(-)